MRWVALIATISAQAQAIGPAIPGVRHYRLCTATVSVPSARPPRKLSERPSPSCCPVRSAIEENARKAAPLM
jgi:hypothetical protein